MFVYNDNTTCNNKNRMPFLGILNYIIVFIELLSNLMHPDFKQ